jgi:hypothetical protein
MQRTEYMQKIMMATYNDVAIEALKNGFDGAWERLIARRLKLDASNGNSEAEVILQANGDNAAIAAKMIYNSKMEQPCQL